MGEPAILISYSKGVRIIKFNRPQRKNAFNAEVYTKFTEILNQDASNDEILITILTGVGDYFTSGNDISVALEGDEEFEVQVKAAVARYKNLVDAFINYPKLIVAVVNGPSIGIGATMLPLCDIVYASNRATFQTPFVPLALCPEACSSYLFPMIMGKSKAGEMLYFNHKMGAHEALQFGLVSSVVEHEKLSGLFEKLMKLGNELLPNPVKISKGLVMNEELRNKLLKINEKEAEQVYRCTMSEDFMQAAMTFASRKSKL